MKPVLIILVVLLACLPAHPAEDEINLGDSKDKVLEVLGKPRGKMKKGNSEYWSYLRGIVRITDGKVTLINIKSEQEAWRDEMERRDLVKDRAEAQRKAREERQQRIKEGTAQKQEKLKNEDFLALPAAEQLEFWRGFQSKYPEVSVKEQISALEPESGEGEDEDAKSERLVLLETIEEKQKELDDWIHRAKTTSAGRTFRRQYHLNKKRLEEELADLREQLKALPEE